MKKAIFTMFVLFSFIIVNAQEKKSNSSSEKQKTEYSINGKEVSINKFAVQHQSDEGTNTDYTYKDSKGNSHPIMKTEKGKYFIWRVSAKTGNKYKQYLNDLKL